MTTEHLSVDHSLAYGVYLTHPNIYKCVFPYNFFAPFLHKV